MIILVCGGLNKYGLYKLTVKCLVNRERHYLRKIRRCVIVGGSVSQVWALRLQKPTSGPGFLSDCLTTDQDAALSNFLLACVQDTPYSPPS